MNNYRAAGQELQGQVLAAARKGQQRVATTVKNVTAAAQHIRPQLANLPKPTLNLSALPGQAQLREKAPALVAKLPAKLPTKLPTADQLKAGAQELAGHARSVQRRVVFQVRSATTPLAHQAATRLAQVGVPAETKTTTRVSQVTVTKTEKAQGESAPSDKAKDEKAKDEKAKDEKAKDEKAKGETTTARAGESAKARTRPAPASAKKPKAKPADK